MILLKFIYNRSGGIQNVPVVKQFSFQVSKLLRYRKMSGFQNSARILVSPNSVHIPRESMGKYVMKCLKGGQQETAYVSCFCFIFDLINSV